MGRRGEGVSATAQVSAAHEEIGVDVESNSVLELMCPREEEDKYVEVVVKIY